MINSHFDLILWAKSTIKVFKPSDLKFLHGSSAQAEDLVIKWLILMWFMLQVFPNKEADATIGGVVGTNFRPNKTSLSHGEELRAKTSFNDKEKAD